jgi:hypothetical protein
MSSGGVKNPARFHQYTRSARKNGSRIREQGNFADPTAKRRDDFNYVVALHIELPGFSISHRVPRVGFGAESFGTTMLWRVTLQRRQGKSPLAIESIDNRYCRRRGVMPSRPAQLALIYESQRGLSQQHSPPLWKLYIPAIGKFRPALRSMGMTVADFIE